MTDQDPTLPPPASESRRSPWRAIAVLLVLAAIGAAGYGGWWLWQQRADTEDTVAAQDVLLRRLSRQLGDAQSGIEALRDKQTELTDSTRRNADGLGQLQGRADETAQALARIDATVQGGRARAQLVAVEQLLLIANDRAQLAHDLKGAATALEFAQDRLGSLAEPKLFEVRKAVADERTALLALPQVDTEAAALSLNSLIERVGDLPQRSRTPHHVAGNEGNDFAELPASGSAWSRAGNTISDLLGRVFIIRRTDKPVDRLLPAEQETLVGQLLLLKLETARTALLRDDTDDFRATIKEAIQFLADYYRPDDPSVQSMRSELERLQGLELSPTPPDLTRSLGLLRAYIDALPH